MARFPRSFCSRLPGAVATVIGLVIPVGVLSVGAPAHALKASLAFSSYWGSGSGINRTVSVDRDGNVYMAGGASEPNWPTTLGAPHSGTGRTDVTVAKFDATGRLIWSRLLGGPDEDYAYVTAVNDQGELYVAGRAGVDFPTTPGAFDRTFNGGPGIGIHDPSDGFVAKLSTDGQLLYSTYIGGNGDDVARAVHLLPSGKLIVAGGNSASTDMPVDKGTLPGPVFRTRRGGAKDAYVAVVAADGRSLDFCTYFGTSDDRPGDGDETVRALGVDAAGNIWLGGTTQGSDLDPTADAFQQTRGSPRGTAESFIGKLSADGTQLRYFSWLGGNGNDEIETEGVSDPAGNFYVTGSTASSDFFTTPGAVQSVLKGGGSAPFAGDGWVAKINNDGTLGFATLYGGSRPGPEGFFGPVVDPAGNVYCTGRFGSADCLVTSDAFQKDKAGLPGYQDAVLVVFNSTGSQLLYASYFGGTGGEQGRHIGIHPDGSAVYIVGETSSADLPLINAPQRTVSGVFWAKFTIATETPPPTLQPTVTTTQLPSLSPTRAATIATRSPSPVNPSATATRSAVVTATGAAVATPTPSVSPPAGTPTDAPEGTPSSSPAASPEPTAPLSFCSASSTAVAPIVVADIVTGVNIALERLPLSACPAIDLNGDGMINVSDLVAAVARLLRASNAAARLSR
jgi:hypothetical protein